MQAPRLVGQWNGARDSSQAGPEINNDCIETVVIQKHKSGLRKKAWPVIMALWDLAGTSLYQSFPDPNGWQRRLFSIIEFDVPAWASRGADRAGLCVVHSVV